MNAMVQSIRDLGPAKLGMIAAVTVVMLGFFLFLALGSSSSGPSSAQMSPLFTQLTASDSAEIVQYLDTNQVPFDVKGGGAQIFVPSDDVNRIRLLLAAEGVPAENSGVGYEIFDRNDALGTSNFVQNVNLLRALEGELARTISSMGKIESARVHLVVPKRELFTRDQKPPTASIAVKMAARDELSKREIQAIRHLVATSVPGLDLKRITIVDNHGRLLARGAEDDEDVSDMVSDADEYRVKYEQRLRNRLQDMVERTVGIGNAQVDVTAYIDFDRIVRKTETFDPEGQVARSVQSISENEQTRERDFDTNVTVANNLPDPDPGGAGLVVEKNVEKTDETTNFEISKEVINHVQEIGTVNRLAVAVLVNGTYDLTEEGDTVYEPRTVEELAELERLVKSAIGYDEQRGDTVEVVNLRFSEPAGEIFEESPLGWLKQDFHNIVQTLILGVVAILAILLVVRPLVNRAIETTTEFEEEEDIESLMGPDVAGQLTDQTDSDDPTAMLGIAGDDDDMLIDMEGVKGGVKSSSVRRINELIDKHPEESLGVLRAWLMEGKV